MTTRFPGFPKKGLSFLHKLEKNNNREWFLDNKKEYTEQVLEPTQHFVQAVGEKLTEINADIQFDPRTNGMGSMMRINRDTRFSKDKSPYKTTIGLVFWIGPKKKKTENPGFFFRWGTEFSTVYSGMHSFDKDILNQYRDVVSKDKAANELRVILKKIDDRKDWSIGGEHYKKVPRGFDPDHPHADLLRHNSVWALSPTIPKDVLNSTKLVSTVVRHCKAASPINEWLLKHLFQ